MLLSVFWINRWLMENWISVLNLSYCRAHKSVRWLRKKLLLLSETNWWISTIWHRIKGQLHSHITHTNNLIHRIIYWMHQFWLLPWNYWKAATQISNHIYQHILLYRFAERGSTQVQILSIHCVLYCITQYIFVVFKLIGMCLKRMKAYCWWDSISCDVLGVKLNW